MKTRVCLLVVSCWLASTAHAASGPLVNDALALGKTVAPTAKKTGETLKGSGDETDWFVNLEAGHCYWFVGAAAAGEMNLYLWDPSGKKATNNKSGQPKVVMGWCPFSAGSYKVKAKGEGEYVVVVLTRKAAPGEMLNPDGSRVNAPAPTSHQDSKSSAPPPPAKTVHCDDSSDGAGYASFVISCDCGAMEVYLDGQLYNFKSGSGRLDKQHSGCHNLKVVAWTGPFARKTWYDGKVKLLPAFESRFQVTNGSVDLVGKTAIVVPKQLDLSPYDDARALLRDAYDRNREDVEACGDRFDRRLGDLYDLVEASARAVTVQNVDQAIRRTQDLIDSADEDCSRREGRNYARKLGRVIDRLRSVRSSLR